MTRTLLVATKNPGKVREFAEMLSDLDVEFRNLAELGETPDVEETGTTFRENAILKARAYAAETGMLTLADDSCLQVDALGGDPGVYTGRYGAPEAKSHEDRYRLLLKNLAGVDSAERTARFRCVIVLAEPDGTILAEAEGVCEGAIADAPKGDGGFGYDPVFLVGGGSQTMAELPSAEKHRISHRGRALQALEPRLRGMLE